MNMEEKASLSLLPVYENISDELLAEAAQFYIYLVTDQDRYLMHWYRKFSDILECGSLSRSIGEFNTVLKQSYFFSTFGVTSFQLLLLDQKKIQSIYQMSTVLT